MNADPDGSSVTPKTHAPPRTPSIQTWYDSVDCWAEAREKIARMTLTIKLDRNWSSFQLANSTPPLSVTGSAIAPSARILNQIGQPKYFQNLLIASGPVKSRETLRAPRCAQTQTTPKTQETKEASNQLATWPANPRFKSVALLIHVAPQTSSTAISMIPSR